MDTSCSDSWAARISILGIDFGSLLNCGAVWKWDGTEDRGQDKDTIDVSQALVGLTLIPGRDKPKLELKLGRQELNYGEGSLLAIRELNVRRTFDGGKAIIRRAGWQLDLLAFRPQLIETGSFDDGIDSSQALWGAWAAKPINGRPFWRQLDFYYLGFDRKQARFEQGTAREQRQTLGVVIHAQQGRFSMFSDSVRPFRCGQYSGLEIRPELVLVIFNPAVASGCNVVGRNRER